MGIAGYSTGHESGVDRTLAAQALLAGIAERGADAVGYAYRGADDAGPVLTKQRTAASALLDRSRSPSTPIELLVHVRDYTKGHPSIEANNHPIRHGPSSASTTGSSSTTTSCSPATPAAAPSRG